MFFIEKIASIRLIKYLCLGLFAYAVIGLVFAFFYPLTRQKARWIIGIGLVVAIFMSIGATLLYWWHHYYR